MTTKKLLVETVTTLSPEDCDEFKSLVLPHVSSSRLKEANAPDVVELMVETYGRECVEKTKHALMKMKKTDLVQRLSEISEKLTAGEQPSLLTQRVVALESAAQLMLETLDGLDDGEDWFFREVLEAQKYLENCETTQVLHVMTEPQDIVVLMVQAYGQKSVEKIADALKKMKRTDLVRRLSDSSSPPRKKELDEHLSALIHKVATMATVKELLLEIVKDLKEEDFKNLSWFLQFTFYQKSLPQSPWSLQVMAEKTQMVDEIIGQCGRQSVEVMAEVLMNLNRTDLVQKLSETSSGPREEECEDESWPALTQKIEGLSSDAELLFETLADLSHNELENLKMATLRLLGHYRVYRPRRLLALMDLQDTVLLVVQGLGHRSVEKIMEILKEMKRPVLAQRLTDRSAPTKKLSVDPQRPALIHKVLTVPAVKLLLGEIVTKLSKEEFEEFTKRMKLMANQRWPFLSFRLTGFSDKAAMARRVVDVLGRQSVEATRQVLINLNRTDLVQMIPETSSGFRDTFFVDETEEERSLTEAAVKRYLWKTFNPFSDKDFKKFKWLLQITLFQNSLPQISKSYLDDADTTVELVDLMVERLGRQSVELSQEVLIDMNWKAVPKESSGGLKGKDPSSPFQIDPDVMLKLLETLELLQSGEREMFWMILLERGFPRIPRSEMDVEDSTFLVKLIMLEYGEHAMEVTLKTLKKIPRMDLVKKLSESISAAKGPSRKPLQEAASCGGVTQDSSSWTKLEPEVNRTDAGGALSYSLQSEAGRFECSVSGFRWVCKEKSSFKYQFCSWDGHMERMESRRYIPAGPLMDITVTAGKFTEAYLPHWICTEDNPKILDKFAVLHIDDCGDVVEKVSEVTASHVKLTDPIFSPRAVLMKWGVPVKYMCNVLIYQTNTAFLTLHVYLVPRDPGLQQNMNQEETSRGYKIISKPHPPKSLKMRNFFRLAASVKEADIYPKPGLQLEYPLGRPNFYEVYIKNANRDFELKLVPEKGPQPVWECAIRRDEYEGHTQAAAFCGGAAGFSSFADVLRALPGAAGMIPEAEEEHFVDKHMVELIQRVSNVGPILDVLRKEKVIHPETYKAIRRLDSCDQIRELYCGPLRADKACKDLFYTALLRNEPRLMAELNRRK